MIALNSGNYSYLYRHNSAIRATKDQMYIKAFQGARIKDSIPDGLMCHLHWETQDSSSEERQNVLKSMDIFIPEGKKLGDIVNVIPHGILNKSITGIGATTLEIKAKRDSIIVVPTRALAYDKFVSNEGAYYIGGAINEINNVADEGISAYHQSDRPYKKFIVVADSLIRLASLLGDEIYKYFLMVDEIDLYQSDVTFRPVLEDVLDIYFSFSKHKRAVVSATIQDFSDPRMQEEPITNLHLEKTTSSQIHVWRTDNVNLAAAKSIQEICATTRDKILVAYNSVTSILQVIELLDDSLKKDCGIWCSENSKKNAKEYFTPHHGKKLDKRIMFMTCAYFAGLDIEERYQSIIVANRARSHSLLSPNRIKQIVGRCRDERGVIKNTMIHNWYTTAQKDKNLEESDFTPARHSTGLEQLNNQAIPIRLIDKKSFIDRITDKAKNIIGARESTEQIYKKYSPNSIANREIDKQLAFMTEENIYSYSVNTVRRDKNGTLQVSYLNIDALGEIVALRNNLYSQMHLLSEALSDAGHEVIWKNETLGFPKEQLEMEKRIEKEQKLLSDDDIQECIAEIEELIDRGQCNHDALVNMRRKKSRPEKNFLDCYIALCPHIEHLELVRILQKEEVYNKDERVKKRIINCGRFWAMEESHPLKQLLTARFRIGERYRTEDIFSKVNEVMETVFQIHLAKPTNAVRLLSHFIAPGTPIHGKNTSYYKIQSYNPLGINGDPIQKIPSTELATEVIDIRNYR